ncbi:MAG: amidohydrolase/deacetylase family metallohydrolase [Ruminococcaceae bacterium]|nr:amidohydrolase/deacetylase family metallohydrolase [Oscillospiraceae bacterium]
MMENADHYHLLLQNAHVVDPANQINAKMDLAIQDGKVACLSPSIKSDTAEKVIDAKGCYVIPGIVDIHTHVYPVFPYVGLACVNADDHLLKAGCTTTVDAGSVGWRDFIYFKESVIDKSVCRVLAFLNISDQGMMDMASEQYCKFMHPEIVASVIKAFPEHLVGIKSAHYRPGGKGGYDRENPAWGSVDKAIEAGVLCGKPCMVDFGVSYDHSPYAEFVTDKLRPGDIHTHVFAQQFPTVDEKGKVYDYMWKARERGVLFDVGHGSGSFWFRNGQQALRDGFPPATISTDLHTGSIRGAAQSMLHTMGKFHNMGMSLEDVILRSTYKPALAINRPDLGNLSVGSCADIALITKIEGDFDYIDNGNAKIKGTSKLDCRMTIRGGEIVFDGYGMSMPLWEDAPRDQYWKAHSWQEQQG